MDAFFAKNRLSAYLDGSLPEGEAVEVEAALAADPALRAEYEGMRRALKLLREVGPVSAPPDLHARIMARVAVDPVVIGPAVWWRRALSRLPMEGIALAAAALVVVIAIQWPPGAPDEPPAAAPEVASVADSVAQTPPPTEAPPPATVAPPRDLDLAKALPVGRESPPKPTASAAPSSKEKAMYTPEWDQDPATGALVGAPTTASASGAATPGADPSGETSVSLRTARYYSLSTQDPEILALLASVASQTGGRLIDGDGQPATTSALTDTKYKTSVSLVVPQGQLGDATSALGRLGARAEASPSAAPLYGADTVTLTVTVFYNP